MAFDSALELTKALVACPSVTPNDSGCQRIIVERLSSLRFDEEFIDRGQTNNLWLRKGSAAPLFVFAGHTDVVPAGEGWLTDPFSPVVSDGKLIGRGTQDMKTSIAAFTEAAAKFIEDYPNHKGSIALLLTSDEEGDGLNGTKMVVESLAVKKVSADFCVVGEPTCVKVLGDTIKNGRRGSENGKLIVKGVQGHVAYPEKVKNPIHAAAKLIERLASTDWDQGYPGFPKTSFQVSNIKAGTGTVNVVPETCEVLFNVRYSPALSAEKIEEKISAMCKDLDCTCEIEWQRSALPFETKGKTLASALSGAIKDVCGVTAEFSTSGGTSDARFISTWCPEVVEFGPVNDLIHKANESIDTDQIGKLAQVYYELLKKLLS